MPSEFEQGLTLQDLLKILWEKWLVIAASIVLCFTISAIYSYEFLEDYYIAESSMIVQVDSLTDSEYTSYLTGERLVETYSEISTSHVVIYDLIENLELDLTYDQIISMISVNGITDTLIISLEVKSENPELAASIANELVNIVMNLSNDYEGLESIEILDPAYTPTSPSGPNRSLNLVIGILLGGIIGCAVIFMIEVFDNRFKTGKDIEVHLNLRVLGTIPDYVNEEA